MCKWLVDLFKKTEFPVVESKLVPCGTIEGGKMYAILEAKLAEMNDTHAEIYLPDANMKVYRKADVQNFQGLEEVASIKYVAEEHDCDDFAAELFGKFAGLTWTNVHAINWFVDETDNYWFIEPQSKKLSQTLENWQGWDVQFFIGR